VGYRAWAVEVGRRLGLRGWVRNRLDGTVEAMIDGPADSVRAMVEACRTGPAAGLVTRVDEEGADSEPLAPGFTHKPTV
jgi:acylphosphatase